MVQAYLRSVVDAKGVERIFRDRHLSRAVGWPASQRQVVSRSCRRPFDTAKNGRKKRTMLKLPPLHLLMGLPAYLLDTHEPLHSAAYTAAIKSSLALTNPSEDFDQKLEAEVESYYDNDRHITAAVVHLHPLLHGTKALEALKAILRPSETVQTMVELDRREAEAKVYLVLGGAMRLVVENERGQCVEIGQCRPGQWIGLPSLLREFDERESGKQWVRPLQTAVKAIPMNDSVSAQYVLVSDFLRIMSEYPELVRYVRQQVAVRFAKREQILERFRANSICRLLPPGDVEYLMQLGVLRRASSSAIDDTAHRPYLAAGKPSRRVGFVIEGNCTAFIPVAPSASTQNGEKERYAGKFGPGDLFGHEGLVMPEEHTLATTPAKAIPYEEIHVPDFDVREPPRMTSVYATPGAEILEFFWYAFRWTMDDRMATWSRIVQQILVMHHGGRVPEIIAVQSARRKLGASTLAQGLAATLANKLKESVCILDLLGMERFAEHFEPLGFTAEPLKKCLQPTVRAKRSGHRTQRVVQYYRLVAPQYPKTELSWPPDVQLIWPDDKELAANALDLVEILQTEGEFSYVILCLQKDAETADKAAKQLAIQLNSRCSTVLYVTDETEAGYQFSEIEPPNLVWVERMTPGYIERETKRMEQAMNEARLGSWLEILPGAVRPPLTSFVGGLPDENDVSDFECRRKVVRVPEDPEGAKLSDHYGPHALMGHTSKDGPYKRALQRLVRVVMRQTVGVALGGGGAWGFCHVALLQNLKDQGISIDFLTGTSFGSIIGGLYAAGGFDALEKLVDENSQNPQNPLTPFLSPFTTPLIRMVLLGTISTFSIEWFINDLIRRVRPDHPRVVGLGMTEIPFYPISSNLTKHEERTEEHGSVGYGVRLSGTAPPMAPAFRLNGDLIVDGAFVANVPSRHLREIGADFVIAANAVPPAPAEQPPSSTLGQIVDLVMARFNDAMRANQLLTWKSGNDQGELHADFACNLQPKNSSFIEMWKGRTIVEQVRRDHFMGAKASMIRKAYDAFCAKPVAERTRRT